MPTATGSVLISVGETRVICTASAQAGVPRWMTGRGRGWVTAEYGMLPASTGQRKQRDGTRGGPDGRSIEIQRLIGRSLRGVIDFEALGERTIYIDCDVLTADGGTRCASITGGMEKVGQTALDDMADKLAAAIGKGAPATAAVLASFAPVLAAALPHHAGDKNELSDSPTVV